MRVRFADMSLGQPVEFADGMPAGEAIEERLCAMVRRWSGGQDVSVVSIEAPDVNTSNRDFRPHHIAGRVFARHLDGSRYADLDVVMRGGDACRRAVVRVALG